MNLEWLKLRELSKSGGMFLREMTSEKMAQYLVASLGFQLSLRTTHQ